MLDDAEIKRLLLRAAARDAGSPQAFERIYRLCAPVLHGIALRIVHRRELAEEVLHDAFVKIWNAATSFDPLANQPVAWMAAITRNRALDLVSSADVARAQLFSDVAGADEDDADAIIDRLYDWSRAGRDGADDAADDAGSAEDSRRARQWLRDCLGDLAAPERQAVVLAYHHGMSHGELAKHLAKPLGTVKTWMRRALDNLRTCVEHCMSAQAGR